MGKKKKKARVATAAAAAARTAPAEGGVGDRDAGAGRWAERLRELTDYPTLLLGIVFGAFTILSAFMCVRFRNNPEMGGIREPTALILWAGITVTLLASYFRERRRVTPAS